ncbi:hypothetical protein SteCoe_9811 [Stentor coeruleus]|uniref:Uncharacterized protein n=1 Tax=Stentor coeruleus TaxID=5963 RepID=A0A1R2CH31_9CILI|nr:hypothetical protein SteCoe_9811 [Stentor coeruleus]
MISPNVFTPSQSPSFLKTIYPSNLTTFTNKKPISPELSKAESALPPVKEIKKALETNNSGFLKTKTIFLNFTGKNDLSQSPKHIRVPKHRNDTDIKYSYRNHISNNSTKYNKQLRLFNPPIAIEKDYFNSKIKKTVKKYFHIRRTSLGNNFNAYEMMNDKSRKISPDVFRGKEKQPIIFFDGDDKNEGSKEIGFIDKKSSKKFVFVSFQDLVQTPDRMKDFMMKGPKKNKEYGKIGGEKRSSRKVDQGLQTDGEYFCSENDSIQNPLSKMTMYEIEDNKSESNDGF